MPSPLPRVWDAARIARVLNLWNQGWSAPAIARDLGASRHSVESKLAKLRRAGLAVARRHRASPVASQRAWRRCLHCGLPFDSEHVGNRLCPTCLVEGPFTSAMV
jgi:hypothetical protein